MPDHCWHLPNPVSHSEARRWGRSFHLMSLVQSPTTLYNAVIHLHHWLWKNEPEKCRQTPNFCYEHDFGGWQTKFIRREKQIPLIVLRSPLGQIMCFPLIFTAYVPAALCMAYESAACKYVCLSAAAARGYLGGSCSCGQHDWLHPMNTEPSAYSRTPRGSHYYHITSSLPRLWIAN